MSDITKKDLQSLKDRILYNPMTGQFFRKTSPTIPMVLYNRDRASFLLKVTVSGRTKWHQAWRVAFFLAQGYYPVYEDSICYKDNNNANFTITNLEIIKKSENEITSKDFAKLYGLSINTVKKKFNKLPFVYRVINRRVTHFYNLETALSVCADLIHKKMLKDDVEHIDDLIKIEKSIYDGKERGNDMIRAFLSTWYDEMPKRWEMTLC